MNNTQHMRSSLQDSCASTDVDMADAGENGDKS